MYSPDSFAYRDWLGSLADSKTDLIVRSSREQSWTGLDVALLRYTDQQIAAPAFSSHLIVLHLTQIPRFIGKVNRQTYEATVREGESSILAAGVASEWQWQTRGQCDTLHLALERAFVRQVADEHGYANVDQIEVLNRFIVDDPQIRHIGLALKAELESVGISGRLFSESLATALASRLLGQYTALAPRTVRSQAGLSRSQQQLVIDYINDNINQDLRLAELAAAVGMSQSHFTRQFKQSLGITPHQYVIQCRVERARLLLQRGELTIRQVATVVGFADQSHLTYHFKRILGITPNQFLQQ